MCYRVKGWLRNTACIIWCFGCGCGMNHCERLISRNNWSKYSQICDCGKQQWKTGQAEKYHVQYKKNAHCYIDKTCFEKKLQGFWYKLPALQYKLLCTICKTYLLKLNSLNINLRHRSLNMHLKLHASQPKHDQPSNNSTTIPTPHQSPSTSNTANMDGIWSSATNIKAR